MNHKRIFAALLLMMSAVFTFTLSSCDDDRGEKMNIRNYDNTYVKYKFNVGSGLASLYNIEVTYCDMSGKEFTEDFKLRRSGNTWEYKDEHEGNQKINFKFIVTATLKESYELEDDEYDMGHAFTVNWYDQTSKAMSYSPVDQQVESMVIAKDDIQEFLDKNPVITIANVTERPQ